MSGERYTSVEEQVEFAAAKISEHERIEVSARDLVFVYETLGEFIRFFHQRMHWPTKADVERFMGDKDSGALRLLFECYYKKLYGVWPPAISAAIDRGDLEPPDPPYYFEPSKDDG
jgi:hypothetical protein